MPEICRFFGIVIAMYFNDHNPPHFHAAYGAHEATITIKDSALLTGYLPPRAMGLVVEWSLEHKKELMENWELARKQTKSLRKIKPLQ